MIYGRKIRSPSKYAMPFKNAHGNHPKNNRTTPRTFRYLKWEESWLNLIIFGAILGVGFPLLHKADYPYTVSSVVYRLPPFWGTTEVWGLGKLVKKQLFHLDSWKRRIFGDFGWEGVGLAGAPRWCPKSPLPWFSHWNIDDLFFWCSTSSCQRNLQCLIILIWPFNTV